METRMLAYESAATMTQIALWANDLVGKEVPGLPDYRVVKVIQFQILNAKEGYDAMILVEVSERPPDTDALMLRKADIEVIEDLTATIEPVQGEIIPNE